MIFINRHCPSALLTIALSRVLPTKITFLWQCILALLPNKDTWTHHVTFMTCEVLKGPKVKGGFHGRAALSDSASGLSHHHPPLFPFSCCKHGSVSQMLFVPHVNRKQTQECYTTASVILNTKCDYKWALPHQCTIKATAGAIESLENTKAQSTWKSFTNLLCWTSHQTSDQHWSDF